LTHVGSNFEAILFDVDGTLLDSIQDLADSMNSTLGHFGFPIHGVDRYKYFVGDGMENLVRRALPDSVGTDSALVSECLQMMRQTYDLNWKKKTRPYPGIPELLDGLTDHNVRMAVLSNKPDYFTQKVIKELLPSWRFEIVMGERPSVPRKPDPSSAIEISERLGIRPENFLYLGDTATDMLTANAAGMFAVGALWGFRKAEELISSGAKELISTPLEILRLL
jgi:phosphoglycolate phosphatase